MPIVTDVKAYPYGDIPGPMVGASAQVITGALVTEFSTGRIRKRLNGYGVNQQVNLQWLFSLRELRIFEGWWRNVLMNGQAEFLLVDFPMDGKEVGLWTGIFTKDYQKTSVAGPYMQVAATAVFRDSPHDNWTQFLQFLNPDWQDYFMTIPDAINFYYNGKWNNVL
jgi:hypothetical protein